MKMKISIHFIALFIATAVALGGNEKGERSVAQDLPAVAPRAVCGPSLGPRTDCRPGLGPE